MAVIHISEADAARDFTAAAAHVKAGDEVFIDSETTPMVLKAALPKPRTISESIAGLRARSKRLGYAPIMDEDFVADMEEIIRNRKPRETSAWD